MSLRARALSVPAENIFTHCGVTSAGVVVVCERVCVFNTRNKARCVCVCVFTRVCVQVLRTKCHERPRAKCTHMRTHM